MVKCIQLIWYLCIFFKMAIVFESEEEDLKTLMCYCEGHCPFGEYGNCETKPGGKCFTAVELDVDDDGKEYPILSYGCLPPNEMALFQCRAKLIASRENKNIKCCDEYDYCNKHLLPVVQTQNNLSNDFLHSMTLKLLISSLSISFIIFTIVLVLVYLKHRKQEEQNLEINKASEELEAGKAINIANINNVLNFPISDNSIVSLGMETSQSRSESDYELPGFVQRTISKQLHLEIMIASGKYGEVWKAKWRGEKVAVKVYFPKEEQKWLREIDIYQTVLMRHENILGFIAADVKGSGPQSQMIVITEYHEHGSLRDYLKNHSISPLEILKMSKSISSGLNHLHNEIFGCKGKPAIAHNNISTKNILVKKNKECCLGDFKKTVKFFNSRNKIDVPSNTENSEIRYLAPEILEKNFDKSNFECFKMADVYSFSLVLWELANRCHFEPIITTSEYQLPYENELISENYHLSWNALVEVVVKKKTRPVLRKEWENNPILKTISKIIEECWNSNPFVRLTSLRIKKTLFKIHPENSEEVV